MMGMVYMIAFSTQVYPPKSAKDYTAIIHKINIGTLLLLSTVTRVPISGHLTIASKRLMITGVHSSTVVIIHMINQHSGSGISMEAN